jgi:hypothetical protein
MQARKALLKKLASITDWDTARPMPLEGESWVETRNTLYCLWEATCVAVSSQDPARLERARPLVGMRLVGFLRPTEGGTLFTYEWSAGACAVLWRPGLDGAEDMMGMTSPTTALRRGKSPMHLQALHDKAPPADSQTFSRGSSPAGTTSRPSFPSFRSGS